MIDIIRHWFRLLFRKEHLALPTNKGEKRESLIILEKVGLYQGLLKCLGTESEVPIICSFKTYLFV
jgi:hypothetical protein